MKTLRDVHEVLGWVAIGSNGLSGLFALAAWRFKSLRGRAVWIGVIFAESLMMAQATHGVVLHTRGNVKAPSLHMVYGFVAFAAVGLLYSYRYVWKPKNRLELAYGLGGLFLMGLGIRGVLEAL